MDYFVFSGKKKISLRLKNAKFLYKKVLPKFPPSSIKELLNDFFNNHSKAFLDKKVLVVIPDDTRNFHPEMVLKPFARCMKKFTKNITFIISLGLHKKLMKKDLEDFLGKGFIKENKILQHSLKETKPLGTINHIPLCLNRNIFSYDTLFTIGVVEPHLYSGYSGGVKCISIGLAGEETILYTHSVGFLSKRGVGISKIKNNPFCKFLWLTAKRLKMPIFSLNIINNILKETLFFAIGEARGSFLQSVRFANKTFLYKIKDKFDILFVGCDFPKDRTLYQASRLFNYMLDKKRLVKKGGSIFVFANLTTQPKSKAEDNFEEILKRRVLPRGYEFKRPGEHRAFKVIEASGYARLFIITPSIPKNRFSCISFLKDYQTALRWSRKEHGDKLKIGVIPSGFLFVPR